MTYDEAQFVLQAAEYGSFPGGPSLDPVCDVHLLDILEREDQRNDGYRELSKKLARSTDPRIREAVERILAANLDDRRKAL